MNGSQLNLEAAAVSGRIARARITHIGHDGAVRVSCDGDGSDVPCDIMQTGEGGGLRLTVGDAVVVWFSEGDAGWGIVLGRLGPTRAATQDPEEPPAELVIEARTNLTLRCGEGSITIREDGRILIKGKDLVSHAQRLNRIKGGAVAIN